MSDPIVCWESSDLPALATFGWTGDEHPRVLLRLLLRARAARLQGEADEFEGELRAQADRSLTMTRALLADLPVTDLQAAQLPALADLIGVLRDGGIPAVVEWWEEMDPPCPAWVPGIEQIQHDPHELGDVLIVRCPDGSFAVEVWDDMCEASRGRAIGQPGEDIEAVVERADTPGDWVL